MAAGLDDLAGLLLTKADTPEALIRLGDVLAEKKCWVEAADRYRQAWLKSLGKVESFTEEEQGNPLPLFLAGHALRMAGRQSEGRKLIDQAHAAPLGNELIRYTFLRALEDRRHVQAMLREADLLSRVSEPSGFYYGGALRLLGTEAAHHKQYRKAADCCEQAMLRFFLPTASFNQTASYLTVPAQIHCLRAASLLADGKHDEATRHINLALTLSPGNVEVAVTLVPELDRHGRKNEAEALFDHCLEPHEKLCQAYPRCASSHNSVAWISACCRRNLDKALAHSQKAVELAPSNAGYLDTLAEVHFQRGDNDKAIAAEKRAIELDPKKTYYRKQLKRLQVGDPSAERPPENDEE